MNTFKHIILALCGGFFIAGCASGEKAELSSSVPAVAMDELQEIKSNAEKNHVDLYAYKEFQKGVDDLNDAINDMKDGDDEKDVMSSLAQAKAHFKKAKREAKNKKGEISKSIIEARSRAQIAGARKTAQLRKDLYKIDSNLRSKSNNFQKDLTVKELSNFQKRYQALEVKAVQNRQLAKFNSIVNRAKNNDADDVAPKTLKQAETDISIAKNEIAQNPRDPAQYYQSVLKANKSAKLLDDVMNKLLGNAKGSPENVALKLVYQERKLGKLSETVGNLQGSLAETQSALDKTSKNLEEQRSQALSAQAQIRYQKAMDAVRKNFNSQEAEVYQQGDRLILRLKNLNFKSGSATIPTASMDLLAKVEGIIKDIQPERVQIQGHTDSTGNSALNQKLSKNRANAVAKYLNSKGSDYDIELRGLGASQPLANNDTKKGRSLNRRVDIVIDAR